MRPDATPGGGRWALVFQRTRETVGSIFSRHPHRSRLLAYLDGELSPSQSRRIAKHLEHCAECRAHGELDRWQIDRLLGSQRETPPETVDSRRAELLEILGSMRASQSFLTRPLLALLVGRKAAANEGGQRTAERIVNPLINVILIATMVHIALGLIVWSGWLFTGSLEWARTFFSKAGDLFLAELSAAALYLAVQVARGFAKGEPMRETWFFLSAACGCDLVGSIFSKILATHANGLLPYFWGPAEYRFGLLLSGPIRLLVLGWGLFCALRAYDRAGIFKFHFSKLDRLLIACLAWYVLCEDIQGVLARRVDGLWSWSYFLESATDPLLLVAFGMVLLLRRSVQNLGASRVARSWTAIAWAFGFIFLGNITTWALNSGFLPLSVTSIGWNIWFAAAAGFPLAFAFQLQAMVKTAEFLDGRGTAPTPAEGEHLS